MCNRASESDVVPEDWISVVNIPLYKVKGKRTTECQNYRDISLLSVVGKTYAGILVDRVHRGTEGLIYDEQGCIRSDKGCVDQILGRGKRT